jgi:hypothetical protein
MSHAALMSSVVATKMVSHRRFGLIDLLKLLQSAPQLPKKTAGKKH